MKNPKQILLIVVIVVLLGSLTYLTYLLSSGTTPLGMFNLRASNPQDEVDTFLQENNLAPTQEVAPTSDPGLLAYNSTSPTVTPGTGTGTVTPTGSLTPAVSLSPTISPSTSPAATKGGVTATLTPTMTETPTPTPTEFIEITGENMSPTVVTELPVAGIGDNLNAVLIGGGVLILLAFLF